MKLVAGDGFEQRPFADIHTNLLRARAQPGFELLQPCGREQCRDDGEAARQQPAHDLFVRGHEHAGALVFLRALERAIQLQFGSVEGLNGFDVQRCHARIRAARVGNEKPGDSAGRLTQVT